jgi:ribonucleoside-diphosphate reductase alpha chain
MEQESKTIEQIGLQIPRYFSKEGINPFEMFQYEKRTSIIKNPDGSLVFQMNDVEVPNTWSQTATDILAQKYFRKAGIPLVNEEGEPLRDENGKVITGAETSIKQVAHRIAGCWKYWGEKFGYFNNHQDGQIFYEEMVYMIIGQYASPNSPQWFNTGLNWAYGITGPAQGHSYIDPVTKKLEYTKDAYTRCQPHACFIQSLSDDLVRKGGIFSLLTREARVFKYGSGSGTNFSSLRGKGESLSGGGTSSGMMSFLKIFDVAASSIKSGGTTRRAAKMVCLDLDHPEIETFVWWKVKEEEKVADLVTGSKILKSKLGKLISLCKNKEDPLNDKEVKKALKVAAKNGIPINYLVRAMDLAKQNYDLPLQEFDTHYESEAYITVSGQNSNNSVRIPNHFFTALEEGKGWELKARTNGETMNTISAQKLWDDIGYCAWASADPGVQFDTTINEWHTCPENGRINASNPCSEYNFLDNTACNLASINLVKFYNNEEGHFDINGYLHAIRLWTIALEISVLMASFVSEEMATRSYEFRTLGLGFANLGSLLMLQSIPYDSDKGRAVAGALSAILTGESYATSAELAKVLGPFEHYEQNKEHMLKVIRNHRYAAYDEDKYEDLTIKPKGLSEELCPLNLLQAARQAWDKALQNGESYGYRNAQVTVMAPTGTIAFVMDCDTTGVEPDYALVKYKKLAGGGFFKIVNQSVPKALHKLAYDDDQIKEIITYCIGHGKFEGSPCINKESLLNKGLSLEVINLIEKELPNAMDIKLMFNEWNIGKERYNQLTNNGQEDVLSALGFSKEQIQAANDYICGTMTIEGAPYLKEEHYPIFDCANRCGKIGQRFIEPYGHLKILATIQPFISGAISKTINMPRESTVEEIKQAYHDAWKMMVKAVALYRDGCKLSQPLNTTLDEHPELKEILEEPDEVDEDNENNNEIRKNIKLGPVGLELKAKLEDSLPQEINLNLTGSTPIQESMMQALVNSVNLSLQNGLTPMVIAEHSLNVEGHPIIKELHTFLTEINPEVSEETTEKLVTNSENILNKENFSSIIADNKENQMKCVTCGAARLRRNGTCMVCEICGDTTGCS